jgi:hypothetical protein
MTRRSTFVVAFAMVAVALPAGDAAAEPGTTSPNASCVAILSDAEAHLFPAGFVGQEVSGVATSAPGLVGEFSSTVAKNHAGTLEGCIVG